MFHERLRADLPDKEFDIRLEPTTLATRELRGSHRFNRGTEIYQAAVEQYIRAHGLKVVVVKSILPNLADRAHFQQMFLDEARVAARLDHPNIVSTYELGEIDGRYFISMEYLPGEDLATILSRCRLEGRVLPIQIAAARSAGR